MKHTRSQITYTERDGILYPNLELPDQPPHSLGKYGRMHLAFLKEHRKGTYAMLLASGKLNEHLVEVDRDATEMYHSLISQLAQSEGITESLKATDPLVGA